MHGSLPPEVFARLQQHWGYTKLRPLQPEAVQAALSGRDSLVVLPTGGGKSLCYQLPAVVRGGLTVVVSPLIALMKDQVDSLTRSGVAAVRLDSSLDERERALAEKSIRQGEVLLAFTSPERLIHTDLAALLRAAGVHAVAVDEAHCVSHWGHDFRPEYRQLTRLREFFPKASVHAYTATATSRVQQDIIVQLGLRAPEVLVGSFDRPNLTFRVLPKVDEFAQVRQVLDRHAGSGGIVYCLRRRDVDLLTARLKRAGYRVASYHAGMQPQERKKAQDAFVSESVDVVVATIAFGMGIDRSNVRFVVHSAMPKSIEHYQQETGRAGRDGLPAECVLLFSGADVAAMKWIVRKSNEEAGVDATITAATLAQIDGMANFCRGAMCRHRAIVEYFGQTLSESNCSACDICLGDTEPVADATIIAQKILSCVARVKEGFGMVQVVEILRGSRAKSVTDRGHDTLSTWGLLRGHADGELKDFISQLISQGILARDEGDYPVLKLTPAAWEVMRGTRQCRLLRLKAPARSAVKPAAEPRARDELFEVLRQLRKAIADREGVPPFVIFHDTTLHELTRLKPASTAEFLSISGVGEKKLQAYGAEFLAAIVQFRQKKTAAVNPSGDPSDITA